MLEKHFQREGVAIAGLLFATVMWGATFIMVKWTVATLDVYTFLFLRFLIAFLALAIVFHRHLFTADRHTIRAAFVTSIFLAVAYITQSEGLRFTTAGNSAMITGLYIVLVPLFSSLMTQERPSTLSLTGIGVSVFGLFLLTQYSLGGANFGDAITLVCAVACAWHIICTGHYTQRHSIISLVLYQFFFITLFCGVITFARHSFTLTIEPIGWITIITTAVFATAVAFMIQTAAQRVVDTTRTSLILTMEAVFGALFGWWWGGETLTPTAFMGASLMVIGMMIAESRSMAKAMIDKIVG